MPWEFNRNEFVEGDRYSREYLKDACGINSMRGIPPKNGFVRRNSILQREFVIFTLSTQRGKAEGYEDRREGKVFLYYGMGTRGPMKPNNRENTAVRTHFDKGFDLVLFDEPEALSGELRFIGQFECHHYLWPVRALGEGLTADTERNAIVFEFTPIGEATKIFETLHEEEGSKYFKKGGWKRKSVNDKP